MWRESVAGRGGGGERRRPAADEISSALSAAFDKFGQEFQWCSVQARAFHAEFVKVMNAGAQAYAGTELANAEQTVANAIEGPATAQSVGTRASRWPPRRRHARRSEVTRAPC
ncbi:PE family protein [Mycobacterium sp. 1081908.1]|uniref:PE family protein n=1 Tax=Mycobacterium sp. 1081908.1 TaxID=1834066 RepID=UPI0009ED6E53